MYGFRISKPGFDVETAAAKDLVLDSEIPCLKLLQLGRQDLTLANGASQNFTHAITTSMPVLVLVYLYEPSNAGYFALTGQALGNPLATTINGNYEFSSSTLYVTVNNNTGASVTTNYIWYVGYA